jgi:DnaJ-class molecular chaperone
MPDLQQEPAACCGCRGQGRIADDIPCPSCGGSGLAVDEQRVTGAKFIVQVGSTVHYCYTVEELGAVFGAWLSGPRGNDVH